MLSFKHHLIVFKHPVTERHFQCSRLIERNLMDQAYWLERERDAIANARAAISPTCSSSITNLRKGTA